MQRLYRKSLKTCNSWCVDRIIWLEEANKIRDEFESNRDANPAKTIRLVEAAEARFVEFTHPDNYCVPEMPGGSKFMRNPPLPLEVCYPDGDFPEGVQLPKRTVNPDFSTFVEGGGLSGSGQVVVDFTTKSMT